ncbi:dihydrolipoyllysine-residue acetyltransferase component of pyruvate dehydrogenase complex-like isoform X2 [Panulirus ornatus]|uniref:dihydrolipoyllysine-residue acetyltransferase component of pyruvate dehydrogenase complex-like isoform X2 n=1 Tax=Panulirus ornatus TaxID=150431 RepID=UPI003A87E45B
MAAISSRSIGRLLQNLHRIKLSKASKLNYVYAAFFHSSSSRNAEGLPIKMPSLSPTMMEGTIVKWLKKEGDPIQPGDVLCDIQTDKAVVSMDTEEEGILAKILVPDDTKDVKVGTLIAVMAAEGDDWRTIEIPCVEGASVSAANTQPVVDTSVSTPVTDAGHGNYGPSVRLLLEQYGLEADQVPHKGPHGILLKGDVLQTIREKNLQPRVLPTVPPPEVSKPAAAPSAPASAAPISVPPPVIGVSEDSYDVEVTSMRRTIAKRLLQSKSGIAHSYGTLECCIDKLLALRKQYKNEGINVSVNDLIIKAVATALSRCPEMNCIWQGDQLVMANQVDISVAVATPAGLITPIVHGADILGVEDIAIKVRDLAGRARENKLKLDEFQGGTFTISNLGMFGITEFTAIINPPQCGILAVGGGRKTLDECGTAISYMSVTLSYDRSAIDDDSAAIFLDTLKQILEDPNTMILGAYPTEVSHPLAALL